MICPKVGDLAPSFTLGTIDGESVTLSGLHGKFFHETVLLYLWVINCSYCQYEMPYIQAIFSEWSKRGLVVLSINPRDKPEAIRDFMVGRGFTFPVALDPEDTITTKYCLEQAVPIYVFIDTNGTIKIVKTGYFNSQGEIEDAINFTKYAPLDNRPPIISNVTVSSITATSVIITWETDEPSTGEVYIDAPGRPEWDNTLGTHHSVSFSRLSGNLSGYLEPHTTYTYGVKSTDYSGNQATMEGVFVTPPAFVPTTPGLQ
jgi:peroxiredoxin